MIKANVCASPTCLDHLSNNLVSRAAASVLTACSAAVNPANGKPYLSRHFKPADWLIVAAQRATSVSDSSFYNRKKYPKDSLWLKEELKVAKAPVESAAVTQAAWNSEAGCLPDPSACQNAEA